MHHLYRIPIGYISIFCTLLITAQRFHIPLDFIQQIEMYEFGFYQNQHAT